MITSWGERHPSRPRTVDHKRERERARTQWEATCFACRRTKVQSPVASIKGSKVDSDVEGRILRPWEACAGNIELEGPVV